MAARELVGGGGSVRASEREEAEERNEGEGESEGVQGGWGGAEEMTCGVAVARRHRQAAWWRGELGRVRRVLLAREEDDRGGKRRWVGPCWAGWAER